MNGGINKPSSGDGAPPRRDFSAGRSESPGLPAGYLQSGYFDAKGNIIDKLIIEWARELAMKLYQGRMKTAQMRKFYGEARRLDRKLELGSDFEATRAEILKLIPYAHESVKKQKTPPLFEEFMTLNIKWASQKKKDFMEGFINHFECIVAFFPETRD